MKAHVNSSVHDLKQFAKISGEGKIQKAKGKSKEMESAEVKAYLRKLQEIVPFIPKDRKVSKLEVITYVIDYIRELRQTLGMPPSCGDNNFGFDMESMMMMTQALHEDTTTVTLTVINNGSDEEKCSKPSETSLYNAPSTSCRQPLGVISTTANTSTRMCQEVMDKVCRDSS